MWIWTGSTDPSTATGALCRPLAAPPFVPVENLQIVLAALGYQPGTADGIFGARTEAALRAFQTDAGLAADGLAGSRTKAALRTAWNRTGAAGRSIPDGMGCCYRGCM